MSYRMTYRIMSSILKNLTEEQLDDDVTIHLDGEFFGRCNFAAHVGDDILDHGHVYLDLNS